MDLPPVTDRKIMTFVAIDGDVIITAGSIKNQKLPLIRILQIFASTDNLIFGLREDTQTMQLGKILVPEIKPASEIKINDEIK